MKAVRTGIGAAVFLVLAVVGMKFTGVDLWPDIGNPLREETVVRDHTPVLASLDDLAEFHAATGRFSVVIDVEHKTRYIPRQIKGDRTTFLAEADVDAVIDFSELGPDRVLIDEDGSRVIVLLPEPVLDDPDIDNEASGVMNRDRGVLDRLGGVFSDSPTSEKELLLEAEDQIAEAAAASELLERARSNTTAMVEDLLGPLGYDDVVVIFGGDIGEIASP